MWKLVVVSIATVVLGAAVAPAVAGADPLGPRVGVSAGSNVLWESPAEQKADLDFIAASGAKWFGMDLDWPSIQPKRGVWNWSYTDRVVLLARARGLNVVGTLTYAPRWAQPASCPPNTTHCFPANPSDFAAFARAATVRYGINGAGALKSSIRWWQIWNEPNHYPFVQPRVDVGAYVQLLKAVYPAIKLADIYATVIAGGTSPAGDDPGGHDLSPVTFLRFIYGMGGKGSFDAFAHHPYSFPCDPLTDAVWNSFTQTPILYYVMAGNGDGNKKVWGTEVGAPTGADVGVCAENNGVSVTEPVQAWMVYRYLTAWTVDYGAFTGPLIWYQIRDNGTNRMAWDDNLGLLRRDYSAKPGYTQFSSMMKG
jgi:polysaccharide biosynthesis protein PslG